MRGAGRALVTSVVEITSSFQIKYNFQFFKIFSREYFLRAAVGFAPQE
jgi:hypothetical protein